MLVEAPSDRAANSTRGEPGNASKAITCAVVSPVLLSAMSPRGDPIITPRSSVATYSLSLSASSARPLTVTFGITSCHSPPASPERYSAPRVPANSTLELRGSCAITWTRLWRRSSPVRRSFQLSPPSLERYRKLQVPARIVSGSWGLIVSEKISRSTAIP